MAQSYQVNITVTGKDAASAPIGNVSSALNTLAGVAGGMLVAQALSQVGGLVTGVGRDAVNAAADMQRFQISLETLAAREAVQTGAFRNIGEALQSVGGVTEDLMDKLKQLSLISPFTFDTVYNTFRTQMAFGATADMSIKLTGAILDTASALGLTGDATDRMAYNFAQINSIGKIMAMDMRQLRMVGLDLADVMKSQLGLSIEEVNAKLTDGSLTMKQVSEAFVEYAKTNFAGAAQRMSLTFQGLQSSFHDLFFFMSTDMLGGSLETVTGYLTEMFMTARDLQQSGYFAKIGEEISANVDRIMTVFQEMLGASGPEEVLKKLAEGLVKVSDSVADVLEWYNGLSPIQKQLIGDFALLTLAIGPAISAFMAVQKIVAASQVVITAFSTSAAGTAAILGPLALALGAAALAWNAYNKMQQQATEGQANAKTGWDAFFEDTTKNAASAQAALVIYRAKQAEINKIIEDANPLVRALIRSKMDDINTNDALAMTLLKTSLSYEEYATVMQQAGLLLQVKNKTTYDAIRGTDELTGSTNRATDAMYRHRGSLQDTADVLGTATDAQAIYDAGMKKLQLYIQGPLGKEVETFTTKMDDLKSKQAEVNGKIAELEGKTYLTDAQRTELDDLYKEQGTIGQAFNDMAAEHTKATNTIIFNLAAQQLAMSGLDPTAQLAILDELATKMGIADASTREADIALNTLVAATTTQNANNLATAIAFIGQAAEDGRISTEELQSALAILNGTAVFTTVTVTTTYEDIYTSVGRPGKPIHMATGGDYLFTRPTLILAGENGDEEGHFVPRNGLAKENDRGGGMNLTIINRDRASTALALAYVNSLRTKRLNAEMGR